MHELIAKIARLAVSKAAAFCYAVAVGVAGNVAFNFVQQHHAVPAATPSAVESNSAASAPVAAAVPTPIAQPVTASAPAATAPPKPPPGKPVASTPVLPPTPTTVGLPEPEALPAPSLKPAVLRPPPAVSYQSEHPKEPSPETISASPEKSATPLPPLGDPIEVSAPPSPPPGVPSTASLPSVAAKPASPPAGNSSGIDLSDLWHPSRAVEKGLNWAGDQLPRFGKSDPEVTGRPGIAAPIPLLPSAVAGGPSETAQGSAPPSAKPGPGSGGLY